RLSPSYNIHIPEDAFDRETLDSEAEIEAAFHRFWQEQKTTRFRFASGHLLYSHIRQLRRLPNVRVLTMMREPLQQVISLYRHFRTPASPGYRIFVRKYPNFDSFIEDPRWRNCTAAFLGGPDATAAQCLDILSRDYVFCGLFEQVTVSFDMIRLLLALEP